MAASAAAAPGIFDPFEVKGVVFRSRVLRSSLGGRMAYYDGTVTPAWRNFERRFARPEHLLGGIISATIAIDDARHSPLEYPKLSDDRFIGPIAEGVRAVKDLGCAYIVQIGDPGGHTHTSLLPEAADGLSASAGFDFVYGYRNRTTAMTPGEIARTVGQFASAARRVRATGADGVEVTASKGYLIHQFLNPATNRRRDDYGGSPKKRFRLLEEVVREVRREIGDDYLFGVRLSAEDFNYLPLNVRWPPVLPLRDWFFGNTLATTLDYGRWLAALGVDYLHIDSGFGFVNPKGSPGEFPFEGLRLFANSARHLSAKARVRATVLNLVPAWLAGSTLGLGWRFVPAANAGYAASFREATKLPVIANGGFQERSVIAGALAHGQCDLVAIGRPLLANPDLLQAIAEQRPPASGQPCTFCSRCCTRTAVLPLGCYDVSRFGHSNARMQQQILETSADLSP
ncbi:MAG: tRNA-dihydrouridine synthase [Rubrivivax sp.]|nr:tRNA-dihydrouridine synthase [Rubrivivax sp.]